MHDMLECPLGGPLAARKHVAGLGVVALVMLLVAWSGAALARGDDAKAAGSGREDAVTVSQKAAQARLRALSAEERSGLRHSSTVLAIRAVAPAVVAITSSQGRRRNPYVDTIWGRYYREPMGPEAKVSLGSGVIVSPNGTIITNEHVVSKASSIEVRTVDGRRFQAQVVGLAPAVDLAVLRIRSQKPLPWAPLGLTTPLLHGETVVAIGNPFGLEQTVSRGILSSTRRTFRSEKGTLYNWIQTDAAINPGNSGGPLVNLIGEVVGINTAGITGGPGVAFAIPAEVVKVVMAELIRYGRMRFPSLGLDVGPIDGLGVRVASVTPGGAAATAGLRRGDVIRALAGLLVPDQITFWRIARSLLPGQRVPLRLDRGEISLAVAGSDQPLTTEPQGRFQKRLGMRLGNVAEYRRELKLRVSRGAVIVDVNKGGPAWRRNLRRGDVILSVEKQPTDTREDVEKVTARIQAGQQFFIEVQRGEKTFSFIMTF